MSSISSIYFFNFDFSLEGGFCAVKGGKSFASSLSVLKPVTAL